MKNRILFLSIILVLFFSCVQKEKQRELNLVKTISFNTGFIQPDYITTYYDELSKLEYIYIVDKYSKECIKRFLLDGSFIDSIPLRKVNAIAKPYSSNIDVVIPKTLDTTIIITTYSNQIIFIDNLGEIIHDFKIDEILPDSAKFNYEFTSSYCSNIFYSNKLLLNCYPLFYYLADRIDDESLKARANHYFKEMLNYPYFFEISLPDNDSLYSDVNYRFEKSSFLKNTGMYSGAGEFVEQVPKYSVIEDNLYFYATTSPSIFKINLNDFSITNKYKIESKYCEVGVKTVKINTEDDYIYNDQINEWGLSKVRNNIIKELYYSKEDELFYLMLAMKINEFNEMDNPGRNFSILIYDKDFNKLGEYYFEREKYRDRWSMTMTTEGILIQQRPKNLSIDNYGTQTYDLFEFN